jgi:pantoate--beta-alanine ligase
VEVVSHLTRVLEGSRRPGHFRGVSTVLSKLFCLVAPTKSYFGQKDYQQALLVETMVRDLNVPTEIVLVPTVRESDGLALSSRNRYLSPLDRQAALILYRSLEAGRGHILHGVRDPGQVERHMQQVVAREPRADLEYLAVRSAVSLQPQKPLRGQVVILGALRIGGVRLIDNLLVQVAESEET